MSTITTASAGNRELPSNFPAAVLFLGFENQFIVSIVLAPRRMVKAIKRINSKKWFPFRVKKKIMDAKNQKQKLPTTERSRIVGMSSGATPNSVKPQECL